MLPWCDVEGVYWRNFDIIAPKGFLFFLRNNAGLLIFLISLAFMDITIIIVFLVIIWILYCCRCIKCCGFQCTSVENADHFEDDIYGQKGSVVGMCVAGDNTFNMRMGMMCTIYYIFLSSTTDDIVYFKCSLS